MKFFRNLFGREGARQEPVDAPRVDPVPAQDLCPWKLTSDDGTKAQCKERGHCCCEPKK